jgi:hypothetical protein
MPNSFHRQDLKNLGQHVKPTLPPLAGLKIMSRNPVEALMRAQDYVPARSRRIIASGGLHGCTDWFTPNTDPTLVVGSHPGPEDRRRIGAGAVDLTPGCMLEAFVVANPSGQTQINGNEAGGATGGFEVHATWTDTLGGSVSTVHGTSLPSSNEEFGAEPGNMWNQLSKHVVLDIRPPGTDDSEELARWNHCTVEVELFAVGGARIVDSSVFERPHAAAFERDAVGTTWTSHMYGPTSPASAVQPLGFPVTRAGNPGLGQDPRSGTHHIMDVHEAQHRYLGPVAFTLNLAHESTGEQSAVITSPTFVDLSGSGLTTFDVNEPGLCVGSLGYARRWNHNSPFVLRNRVGVSPVILRTLAGSVGDSTIRVMTRHDSYIDVTIPDGPMSWHSTYGWLEHGITPDDASRTVAQFFGHIDGSQGGMEPDELDVAAITCHYAGGYKPAK